MANPTQQPPGGFVAANFTEPGPFSQFLQAPAQQSVQATQAASQHWNGREGGLGVGAGLLTNWINGASAGRARALAQQHEREMQNANRVNQLRQMVVDSDKHEDDKRAMLASLHEEEQKAVNDHIVAAGKSNPFMKALGVVHQTLMGGPPADEFKDERTGEIHKRQIGTVDQKKLDILLHNFQQLPSEGTRRTTASQNMFDMVTTTASEAKAAKEAAQDYTPVTAQDILSQKPDLWKLSNEFETKYRFPSPLTVYMQHLAPPMDPNKALEYNTLRGALGTQGTSSVPGTASGAPAIRVPVGIPGMPNQGMTSSSGGTDQMPGITPSGKQFQHVATNPDGHQIGSDDLQNWVDIKTGQRVQ